MSSDWDVGGMYHACRWCKHYIKGMCHKGFASNIVSDIVYKVAEEGELSGVIEETLNSGFPKELLQGIKELLEDWHISKKRIKELEEFYNEKLPEILDFELKEKLDENISVLYEDRIENMIAGETGVKINNPESFYCCEWE